MTSNDVPLPKVSIIKPLVGMDINLLSNLETFFLMNYASVSIDQIDLIYLVNNSNDF